ncbi:MAG: NUDIX domain-containing protein [Bacteroidota bacterium]|jgi:guanylate kinase/ADP-ribose pyrophosphatase YjhB (NUDIX family)
MIIVISGPSGLSKSYLCWEILDDFKNYYTPKKHTTRKNRPGEDDREYFFITESAFHALRNDDAFDISTRIYDNWYGVTKRELESAIKGEMNAIIILDVFIAQDFKKKHPDTVLVYIMPSEKGELVEYLKDRGIAYDEDPEARIALLDEELNQWKHFDYVIPYINSELTYELLRSAIIGETFRSTRYSLDVQSSFYFQFRNFPRLAVDLVISNESLTKIALIDRWKSPRGWALPGGFVKYGETIRDAVFRETLEETGLKPLDISFIDIFSDPNRDPRMHVVSIAYWAKCRVGGKAGGDARKLKWYALDKLPVNIVFDHTKIIEQAKIKFLSIEK